MISSINSNKNKTFTKRKSSISKKQKRNNSYSISLIQSEKSHIFISNFNLKSSKKRKNNFSNTKINIIINNNSIHTSNYLTPFNTINTINNINSFLDEKSIKDSDNNSTFIYTGNNSSFYNNNNIFDNYLKAEKKNIASQENMFNLPSSGNTIYPQKKSFNKDKNKFNKKLLRLIKKNNVNNNKSKDDNINLRKDKIKMKINKADYSNILYSEKNINKKYYFILFIVLNIIVFIYFFLKMFEPSVNKFFFDNDHNNYIYKTSLLSKDTSITINK